MFTFYRKLFPSISLTPSIAYEETTEKVAQIEVIVRSIRGQRVIQARANRVLNDEVGAGRGSDRVIVSRFRTVYFLGGSIAVRLMSSAKASSRVP